MTGKPQLYLLELILAALCVGVSTLVMHRVFDVMEIQAFFVAFVAVALGLAVFWIYFVPRAALPHQRMLSLATSLFVGMGLAPWVVEPLSEPIFAARSASSGFLSFNPSRIPGFVDALNDKLLQDGFKRRDIGAERIYSRRGVIVSIVPHYIDWKDGKPPMAVDALNENIGWSAQGFWFQVNSVEAEANAYKRELEAWERKIAASKP